MGKIIIEVFSSAFGFILTLAVLVFVFNIPAPFTKAWVKNNHEQALEWILEE